MSIQVTLNFTTAEEAAEAMHKLGGAPVDFSASQVDETLKEAKPKAKRASKPKAEAETPKQNIQANPEDRQEPEAPVEPEMSEEDAEKMFTGEVRPALSSVMAAIGQEDARKFLTNFGGLGAEKLSDLPKEQYRAFVDACNARVEEANAE